MSSTCCLLFYPLPSRFPCPPPLLPRAVKLPRDSRIYIADKDVNVVSFALSLAVVEYQTLVLRGDLDAAEALLDSIPADQNNKIARFLEGQGYKELALKVATDPEHRFDLALALGNLAIAHTLAQEQDTEHKWKTVGDAALAAWDVALARECFAHAKDLGSLLLVLSATADTAGLRELATLATEAAANNVAFAALWQLKDLEGCVELLTRTNRHAEAALFAQTYMPARLPALVKEWKSALEGEGKGKVGRTLGCPGEDEEMFPEFEEWVRLERSGGAVEDLIEVGEEGDEGVPEEEVEVEEEAGEDVEDAEEA